MICQLKCINENLSNHSPCCHRIENCIDWNYERDARIETEFRKFMAYKLSGEQQSFVDIDGLYIDEAASDELDEVVGAAGGADAEGGAAEAIQVEPALADDGAGIAAWLGVEAPEYL